ncbi:type II CAAX endopeptidase family protein [Sediminitomix flava]|uniref:CAAX prenyl protease-like protein n=1 Tax=Sediminitomix flava TaxID=379075 RepID=A0A315ZBS4_SEDFL|nr:type II CAAX endopeptidase family protein [Sediminitomix flava]PWJ42991.1 CAAX prenyl protease-like protein [Sediminitomix flava]
MLLLKKHPIGSFILITFLFTYLIGGSLNIWINQTELNLPKTITLYLSRIGIVIGPAVSAIFMSYLLEKRFGIRSLLYKLIPSQKEITWFITIPISTLFISFSACIFSGISLNLLLEMLSNSWEILLLHYVLQIIIIGFGEELGWRGWLFPKLTETYSFLYSILIFFITWVLWHLPILFSGAEIVIPWFFVAISVTSILTFLWIKTNGNVFVLAYVHGCINAPQFFIENELDLPQEVILESWKVSGFIHLGLSIVFLSLLRKHIVTGLNKRIQ